MQIPDDKSLKYLPLCLCALQVAVSIQAVREALFLASVLALRLQLSSSLFLRSALSTIGIYWALM